MFQGNYQEMMTRYKQLLTYIKSAVTRNHSEKSINSILDYISTSKNVSMTPFIHQLNLRRDNLIFVLLFKHIKTRMHLKELSGAVENCSYLRDPRS